MKKKPKAVCSTNNLTEEEELAQEKKKYMEVSGLAAQQAKEKQRLEEPAPKKKEIADEMTKRLSKLPTTAE